MGFGSDLLFFALATGLGGGELTLSKKATAASTVALLEAASDASALPNPIAMSVSVTLGWEAERSMAWACAAGAADGTGAGAGSRRR